MPSSARACPAHAIRRRGRVTAVTLGDGTAARSRATEPEASNAATRASASQAPQVLHRGYASQAPTLNDFSEECNLKKRVHKHRSRAENCPQGRGLFPPKILPQRQHVVHDAYGDLWRSAYSSTSEFPSADVISYQFRR